MARFVDQRWGAVQELQETRNPVDLPTAYSPPGFQVDSSMSALLTSAFISLVKKTLTEINHNTSWMQPLTSCFEVRNFCSLAGKSLQDPWEMYLSMKTQLLESKPKTSFTCINVCQPLNCWCWNPLTEILSLRKVRQWCRSYFYLLESKLRHCKAFTLAVWKSCNDTAVACSSFYI